MERLERDKASCVMDCIMSFVIILAAVVSIISKSSAICLSVIS